MEHAPSFLEIMTTIGVASIIGASIYIGRKLQILDDLKETITKVKVNMVIVCNYMIKNNTSFDPSELQTFSPFQLTAKGRDFIFQTIKFNDVFNEHKEDFFDFIDSEHPKLKYDVEASAIKSIVALYEKDYMQFLRVFFYNNPTRNLENTAPTLGVFIRDQYLEVHPEITE